MICSILIGYIVISYIVIGIMDAAIILFFDGAMNLDGIFLFMIAPLSLPFVLFKVAYDAIKDENDL